MAKSGITGAKAHVARLKKLAGPEMVDLVGKALFAGGDLIKTEIQISITAGSVSGKGHVPSAPGQPPNSDTGDLVRGVENVQVAPLVVEVSSNSPHARPLEDGTSKMAARPSVGPARDKKKKEVVALVQKAVSVAIKRSGQGNGNQ